MAEGSGGPSGPSSPASPDPKGGGSASTCHPIELVSNLSGVRPYLLGVVFRRHILKRTLYCKCKGISMRCNYSRAAAPVQQGSSVSGDRVVAPPRRRALVVTKSDCALAFQQSVYTGDDSNQALWGSAASTARQMRGAPLPLFFSPPRNLPQQHS